jgi:biotin carboxylase
MSVRADKKRPLLAVLTSPTGLPPMALAGVAADRYDLLWLVDSSAPADRYATAVHTARVHKLGTVLQLEGLSIEQAGAAIAPYEVDGIVTFQDEGMVRLAEIAAELGLLFHTPEVAERLTDKHAQRRSLERGGVRCPRYAVVPEAADDSALAHVKSHVSFPAVLKPRSGTGSKSVVRVPTFEALPAAVADLRRDGVDEPLLVEEFIAAAPSRDNDQLAAFVSVESYVRAGHVSHVAVTGRFKFIEPFRETGLFIPADLSESEHAAVLQLATDAALALEVTNGCLHTEIKLTDDGPWVIEVNGRPGGGVPEMIARVSTLDLYDVACRLALGAPLPSETALGSDRVAFRCIVQHPMCAHRVVSVEGLDRAAAFPGVEKLTQNRVAGQAVDWRKGFYDFIFFAEGTVDSFDELRALDRRLREEVAVSYE